MGCNYLISSPVAVLPLECSACALSSAGKERGSAAPFPFILWCDAHLPLPTPALPIAWR